MKHEKKLSSLVGSVLAFVIALAGIGCIDSAFGLNADMELLSGYLVLWAALCGFCFYFRRGGTVFICICAILTGFLLREGTLEQEVESLLFHLSKFYDGGYGCGVIYWSRADLMAVSVDGGLFVIAAAILSILAYVLCRRKNELPAMLAAIIPLGICLVVTDTIPSEPWLFLLLAGLALLLLTHPVRKKRAYDGIRLSAMLLVPVLLASMLMFALTPQDSYSERMNGLQKFLTSYFYMQPSEDGPPGTGPGSVPGGQKDHVDLTTVGNRELSNKTTLEVLAEATQTLYLRGQSFDDYDGLRWSTSESSTGVDPYWPTQGLENIGYVHVSPKIKQDIILLPYYVAAEGWEYNFRNGAYYNPSQNQYSYYQKILTQDSAGLSATVDYQAALVQQCLRLPEQTAETWLQILATVRIPKNADVMEAARLIEDFVENSALYDLKTGVMPKDQEDFGLWFLQESDTGYCVHFATAATMLLRAQGIPARYVTGYSVGVQRDVRKAVTENEAHAWVEYLHPQLGWQILEATPGFSVSTPVVPEATQPTEPTDPIETNPPEDSEPTDPIETEPTKPTQPTEPTETDPVGTTESTDPTQTDPTGSGNAGLIGTGEGQGGADWKQIRPMILSILGAILAILLIIAQRGIRIRHRRKRMYSGEANKQALARWKYVLRLRRLLRKKAPTHLHELAQKAAYSQHTLTRQELAQFDAWLDEAQKALQAKPWYLRFIYRWIFAVL